jgi:iron-sulfur cluster assembly accessory protein
MIDATPTVIDATPTVVSLTDAAAAKLAELTKEETNPVIGLRVYVYSGGCSGYRYGMMLEDQPTADDNVLSANGVRVYIDANSVPLIQGSQIDYVDTLHGQQPERRLGLRLRLQLPHRGRRGYAPLLLALTGG